MGCRFNLRAILFAMALLVAQKRAQNHEKSKYQEERFYAVYGTCRDRTVPMDRFPLYSVIHGKIRAHLPIVRKCTCCNIIDHFFRIIFCRRLVHEVEAFSYHRWIDRILSLATPRNVFCLNYSWLLQAK